MLRVSSTLLKSVKPTELTYNIASGLLTGRIDDVFISAYAGSGGRAGSKTPGSLNWWLANNPLATHVKQAANNANPGGPLPMGVYKVILHEHRKNWLRLIPVDQAAMFDRAGMAIHGRGPHGSDGCIVPTDFAAVVLLCELVRRRQAAGGPDIYLQVVAVGHDLDRQNRTA
jgi:hypothetical protein